MPELAINTGNRLFETRRANTSAEFPGTLNNQDKAIIREIVRVANAPSTFQVNKNEKIAPLIQLTVESLVESSHAHIKEHQFLIQQAAAYSDPIPKLKPLGNYIHSTTLWHDLKNISFEQYPVAATCIASERAKYLEPTSDITRDHQILDSSIIEQFEMIAIDKNVGDRVFILGSPVHEALSRHGLSSAGAREKLEILAAEGPVRNLVATGDLNVEEAMLKFGIVSHKAREVLENIAAKGAAGDVAGKSFLHIEDVMLKFGIVSTGAREVLEVRVAEGAAAECVSKGWNLESIKAEFGIVSEKAVVKLEEAFVKDRLVPLINNDFSASAALLKYGIKSDSARDLLEAETGLTSGKYRVLRGEPWTEVVRKCGIREDSLAADTLKILADKVANDPHEITRHPVWTG
ncbi:hypothetical protein [Erwinia tasmaniensis]|uniref:Uncharacterized protein n=1 Tax=Erwinia tasmaniensis (strain DSM 17950 / CFBP 7177 / CIP 109463 / NCPPB 4357 / Et1/99) TaxID=465817 RepID=B2VJC0_ERWT9|nr:hypothetical protein [Erwinia tasmaniensis]CAO96525.1 Hypothetical protein ETA_14790 [Erwinia tasmaniensis Et1/99]